MHYNHDQQLCRLCDEEPAIYNGLCELCLSGEESDPTTGKFTLRHAPKHNKRKIYEEED